MCNINKSDKLPIGLEGIIPTTTKLNNILIENETEAEKIIRRIYQLRYFLLLPLDKTQKINELKQLKDAIIQIEQNLIKKAIDKKILNDLPFEVLKHLFETRIIKLQNLHVKIIKEDEEAAKMLAQYDNVVYLFMSSKDIYKLEEKVIAQKKL